MYQVVDILFLVILGYCMVRGLLRGLSGELSSLLAVAVLIVAFWYEFIPLGNLIGELSGLSIIPARLAAGGLILIAVILFRSLISFFLKKTTQAALGKSAEKICGLLSGALRGVIVCTILVLVVNSVCNKEIRSQMSEQSRGVNFINNFVGPELDEYWPLSKEGPQTHE